MEHHAVTSIALQNGVLHSTSWDGAVVRWSTSVVAAELQNQAAAAIKLKSEAAVSQEAPLPEKGVEVQNIFDETDCELLD